MPNIEINNNKENAKIEDTKNQFLSVRNNKLIEIEVENEEHEGGIDNDKEKIDEVPCFDRDND